MPEIDAGLIIIIVSCLIVGFLIGAAITYGWSKRKKKATPPAPIEAAASPQAAQKSAPIPQGPPALAQLWRGESANDLRVEMQGRSYQKASELEPAQRNAMVELLRQWVVWLGYQSPGSTPTPAKPPAARAEAAPKGTAASPAQQIPAGTPVASAPAGEKKIPPAPRSMVEQVDEILHEMQAGLPANATRIKLVDDAQYGIVVWIGLEHYNGIDNIPDAEARQLVRRAVAEWERRSG